MKKMAKKIICLVLMALIIVPMALTGCGEEDYSAKIEKFYATVKQSQSCLDEIADDIYDNWHDAIYNKKFGGDINKAVYYAQLDNQSNFSAVETNEPVIHDLYKEIKDSELSTEIKEVMVAYSDYYEFVVNVSGSYESFSANKENLKKDLASALKHLEMEM